jgi:hypothetical protein
MPLGSIQRSGPSTIGVISPTGCRTLQKGVSRSSAVSGRLLGLRAGVDKTPLLTSATSAVAGASSDDLARLPHLQGSFGRRQQGARDHRIASVPQHVRGGHMKRPALGRPAQQGHRGTNNSATPAAPQGLALCAICGQSVDPGLGGIPIDNEWVHWTPCAGEFERARRPGDRPLLPQARVLELFTRARAAGRLQP